MYEKRLLTTKEAAEYIGLSPSYLKQSRCGQRKINHDAPDFKVINQNSSKPTISYDMRVLDEWIDSLPNGLSDC